MFGDIYTEMVSSPDGGLDCAGGMGCGQRKRRNYAHTTYFGHSVGLPQKRMSSCLDVVKERERHYPPPFTISKVSAAIA